MVDSRLRVYETNNKQTNEHLHKKKRSIVVKKNQVFVEWINACEKIYFIRYEYLYGAPMKLPKNIKWTLVALL